MIAVRNKIDFSEHLDSLLVKYEGDDLEFKSAAGGFPGSFWETYSAFANSNGGVIILGVNEKNNEFSLDGLSEEQVIKYQKDFWNSVNNKSNISCNLLTANDIDIVDYKGYKFILFHIPRASRELRPVYRATQPFKGTYKRNFEGDYLCSEAEVRRMFADADDLHPTDSRILKGYSLEDIDHEAIDKYRQLFKLSSPDHPWLALNDIELLRMLGGYRKDRQTGEEGFTVAGLLMFGKTMSITDNECCPHFFPDYRERLTDDDDVRWTNRICADGTWEANLFNFYQRVLPRLQSVLPKPFKLENNIRREETPAHIAVREALINLCVHADYSINASLVVTHKANEFIFSNPGTMLVSKDQYYTGGESVCRNKSLQKMFSMLGVAEKAGSGTDKIMKGWREANWRSPKVDEQLQPDKVVLVMPMESLLSDKAKNELTAKFGITANSFDHHVMSILALACEEGSVSNDRLRYALNMHKAEISELLRQMVKKKLLSSFGYGRGTRYTLSQEKINILGINNSNSVSKVATSVDSKVATSDSKVATSDSKVATSNDANVATSSAKVATTAKRRMKSEELTELIREVALDWVELTEIATKTGKKYDYLRNKIIPQLLEQHVIEMMYPGTPNHPNQKYKATSQNAQNVL